MDQRCGVLIMIEYEDIKIYENNILKEIPHVDMVMYKDKPYLKYENNDLLIYIKYDEEIHEKK